MSESRIAKNGSAYRALLQQTAIADVRPGSSMLTDQQWEDMAEILRLTRREKEVCRELFNGYTRIQIAEHLGIKPRTVRHYMEHIHQKLVVTNRVGVVLRIIQVRDRLASKQPVQVADEAPVLSAAVEAEMNP